MKSMRSLYKKLFHYVPDKRILAYFSMALSAAAVCSYMGAYWFLWQSIVSILVIPVYEKAMYDAIIVVILMILRGILNIASATCSHYLGFRLETNLRKNGLHKLLDASSSFFDHNSSGEIRKIIDDNAAETHKTVAHLIPDNVTAVMTPVLMFVLMFAIDYRLGILLILTTVIGVLQYRKMSGGTEFLSGYSAALQKMSAATVEYVRGMQIIKIFGVTVQYYKTLINSIKEYKQYVYQYSLSCKNPYVGFQVLFNVFYAFAVPAAVVFISYGEPAMLILAKIVFFAVFSGAVFTSFTSIMFTGQDNFGAQNTLNQLDELTTSMDQAKLPHGNEETFQDFNIEFRHVDFKYDDNFVLKDFSLTLHQNKTYALIGSSGGGKSTIAKLISGFYPVDGGEILIGGKNIQSYSEKALIQNIAFVFQRSQLLKTSIYENVRIGNPQATRQQIMDALDAANCTSILDKFPQREMTVIGAKGVYLSGGEVQRIAIARAILKNANIVIMDEASAAADPENEYELQQAFQKLMRGKTVIMIAHRLSSIQWLSGMFTGELGTSLTTHQPIVKDLHKYLATTTSLVGMAILWIIVLTVPISLLCARKRNRLFDQVTRGITICGICVPTFWLGFLLLLFFAIHLKWFSVLPSPGWRGFLLPSFALAVPSSCSLIRIMRSSLLAELSSDYVRFAKARGLSANRILVCHILRNALPPVVTIFFQQFGFLIAGGAVIESVFSIKGIGTYLVDSVIAADTIAVSTCIVVIAAIFVVANFMADIINRLLCPWMVREENDT